MSLMSNFGAPQSAMIEGPGERVSLTDRLIRNRKDLEGRLERTNRAIEILDANPEMQELLDIVSSVY